MPAEKENDESAEREERPERHRLLASPEPFSNWILSLVEDGFVVGLGFLALKYPAAAAVVVVIGVIVLVAFASWIYRALRRRFGRGSGAGSETPQPPRLRNSATPR